MAIKSINDVDKLFADALKKPTVNASGLFVCPSCDKTYKTEKGYRAHLEAASCVDMRAFYSGTIMEAEAFNTTKTLLTHFQRRVPSFMGFVKGNLYQQALKFQVTMSYHGLDHIKFDYLYWVINKIETENINAVYKYACVEGVIKNFKEYFHTCLDSLHISEQVWEVFNSNETTTDNDFVRLFEKCRIGVQHIRDIQGVSDRFDKLPMDYAERIMEVAGL